MGECRKQFEAWYGKEYSNYALTLKEDDKYTNFDTELAWQSWKKAKAVGMREAAKIAADMWVGWFQHPAPIAVCVSINEAILKAAEMVEANK